MSDSKEICHLEQWFKTAGIDVNDPKIITLINKILAADEARYASHEQHVTSLHVAIDNLTDVLQNYQNKYLALKQSLNETRDQLDDCTTSNKSLAEYIERLQDKNIKLANQLTGERRGYTKQLRVMKKRNGVVLKALGKSLELVQAPRKPRMRIKDYQELLDKINDALMEALLNQKKKKEEE